jgi:Kef-type K+ transport system membrane component KefB
VHEQDPIVFSLFVVFTGATLVATLALFARQALPVAYIVGGLLAGPSVLGLVREPELIRGMADVGIIFLLFLLGLDLAPRGLIHMLRKATLITALSSLLFALLGAAVALAFGYGAVDATIIGGAMMFSSTIIGLKLLPTTALHHQRMGEVIISVLLLQDLLAIAILLLLEGMAAGSGWSAALLALLGLPAVLLVALGGARYLLIPLIRRFDKIREFIFLTAIGWCLSIAVLASLVGVSSHLGAFLAGVALATSPIALYIADSLKPLRDFFLVLFFFSLGAGFDLAMLADVAVPALTLATIMVVVKPFTFARLLARVGEGGARALETGFRLGQVSEFSLLIAVLALARGAISYQASSLIQAATVLTFVASTYLVVLRYPTPVAISDRLRRD